MDETCRNPAIAYFPRYEPSQKRSHRGGPEEDRLVVVDIKDASEHPRLPHEGVRSRNRQRQQELDDDHPGDDQEDGVADIDDSDVWAGLGSPLLLVVGDAREKLDALL